MGATIGAHVRRLREQRGVTAAQLARDAGLGKASLSTIEAGRGNPTIGTLSAIARALHLPIADLLAESAQAPETVVRRASDIQTGEVSREFLHRIGAGFQTEVWRLHMPENHTLPGVPHAGGTIEHLLVTEGQLTATTGNDKTTLSRGDMLTFRGDVPHGYTTSASTADVIVLLASSSHEIQPTRSPRNR